MGFEIGPENGLGDWTQHQLLSLASVNDGIIQVSDCLQKQNMMIDDINKTLNNVNNETYINPHFFTGHSITTVTAKGHFWWE